MNYFLKIETEIYDDDFGLKIKNFKKINQYKSKMLNSYFKDENFNSKDNQDIFSCYNKIGWETYFGNGNEVIKNDNLEFTNEAKEIIENNSVKILNIFINKVNSNILIVEMNEDNYKKFQFFKNEVLIMMDIRNFYFETK